MRDFRFRAWDKNDGMSPSFGIDFLLMAKPRDIAEASIFMQYTGLKDKNGNEIYEGDIVAIAFWNGVDMADIENGVIKWHEESSAFKWFSGEPSDANNYWLTHADSKHREVVGNIYENPEILP